MPSVIRRNPNNQLSPLMLQRNSAQQPSPAMPITRPAGMMASGAPAVSSGIRVPGPQSTQSSFNLTDRINDQRLRRGEITPEEHLKLRGIAQGNAHNALKQDVAGARLMEQNAISRGVTGTPVEALSRRVGDLSGQSLAMQRDAAQTAQDVDRTNQAMARGMNLKQFDDYQIGLSRQKAEQDQIAADTSLKRAQAEQLVPAQAGELASRGVSNIMQPITDFGGKVVSAVGDYMGRRTAAGAERYAADTRAKTDLEVAKVKGEADVRAAQFAAQTPRREYLDPRQEARIKFLQDEADSIRRMHADPISNPMTEESQSQLAAIQQELDSLTKPAQAAPQIQNASQEITATNPQTGERVVFRNGQWVPIQ